jgi:glycosyltransferase involved in cell wall biosynthesis
MTPDADVSIVMCAWKPRIDWLFDAVRSALDQEDCGLELVVVDDGSSEPVKPLLDGIEDARLRIVRTEHGGLSHARNAGIAAARGRFFRFADADDVLEARSTARLLRLADGGNAIAYGATAVCDDQLRPLEVKSSRLEGWIARACLLYRFDVRHMSMLFPRRVVEAVGEWDESLRQCQDWDFVLRALEQAPARRDPETATYYRRHSAAASGNVEGALHYQTLVVDRYFQRHPQQAGTALEREARAKLLLVRAEACPRLGLGRRDRLALTLRAVGMHPRRATEELGLEAVQVCKRVVNRIWNPAGATTVRR